MELPRHDDDCDEDFETQFMIHQSLQELFKIDPVEDTLVDESFVEETPDLSDRRRIVEAIRTGDEQALLKLESPYRTFAHADERGWLLLHEAAIQLDKNILAITLKATFPSMWDDTTLHGETPLFLAVIHCQPQNVDFLLMNGSNPDAKNEDGDSPLIMAIRHGSYEMASLLICAKASVNLRCVNNRTALHEAARLGHKDIVQFLLHAGAEPDAHSNYGLTPLALASQNGYIEIIETLLQKGANILSQATDSASIIFEAAAGGNPDAIALLLDYGADPNVPKQSGHLPIHRAAYRGHLLALKMLIPVTAFAAIKRSGISPIHSAAAGGHPQCLELLIQSNFDVNFMLDQHVRKGYDDQRKSALYFAVANADACSTKLLLDAGALPNQDPVNCLQVALRMANYELVSMLLRHGANVNYFCRVNTLHFPSALQYTLKDEILLRMLLNYGYNVRLCFDCPYGDKEHTPYGFEGWSSPVIKDTLFCEVITLRWLQDLSGTVVRALLDYVDQVEICCKLKKVLIEQPQWPEINAILTNPRALKHLCRLKIRQRMGRLRLRCPVFMTFLPLPQLLKDYVLYKEYNLYEQRILSVSP